MAGKSKKVPKGFGELETLLANMPEARRALGLAGKDRVNSLKTLRKKMASEGFEPEAVDAELELWQGTKELKGLLTVLDAEDEKKPEENPNQRDIEDKPDMATWDKTTDQVRELVSGIVSDHKPVAAIRMLNNLEDGEKQRKGGHRESVLKVIAAARRPLVAKVEKVDQGVN
jgi:hypothetical protein